MTPRRFATFTLILFAFLLSVTGVPGAEESVPVKVLTIFPTGETPRVSQFTVTFNQPMIPLGDMKQPESTSPMKVTPAMKGQYRWLNVYTLAFEPEKPIEGSQQGSITVKKGTRSVSGEVLKESVSVDYNLPLITVESTNPQPNATGLPLKPKIALYFNQPVELSSLNSGAYFLTKSGRKIGCTATEDEKANKNRNPGARWTAIVEPVEDLPRNTIFDIVLPAGIIPQNGQTPSQQSLTFSYQTYGPLKLQEIIGYRNNESQLYDPESGLEVVFTNSVETSDIRKHLKLSPKYDLDVEDDESGYSGLTRSFWIPGPFSAETTYTITVEPGLKDEFGQEITGKTKIQVKLGPARPVLDLPGREGVLEVIDEPQYPYQVRNIDRVHLRGAFLKPENAIPFIIKNKLYRYLYESETDVLADLPPHEIKTAVLDIKSRPNVMTYQPVNIKEIFGSDAGSGLLYFDLNAKETNSVKTGKPIYRRALVQVTDIGISAKTGMTNTLIWATNLKTGRPQAEVRLEIRNSENHILWRGETDEQGMATAPGAATLRVKKSDDNYGEPLIFILAYHDDQFCMISSEWNKGVSPWNFGLRARELNEGPEIMTWALTSLPLYKPGDNVQFKIIRRENTASGLKAPREQRVFVHIRDSRGKLVSKMTLTPTKFGTCSGGFTLPDNAPLGGYSVQAGKSADQMDYVGSFNVELYRKPTFAIKIDPSKDTAYTGDNLSADISATYHFGAPVKKRPAYCYISAETANYSIPKFEDYSIVNWHSDSEDTEEPVSAIMEKEAELDESGRLKINFTATASKKPEPRDFIIETSVTDVDQRTIGSRKSILVHPASFYLGLKTDNYLVGKGEALNFKVLASDPDGRIMKDVETDLVLYRRSWQTVRRKGVGGYYHYISKTSDKLIDKMKVKTLSSPLDLSFTVDESGYYFIAASSIDAEGRPVTSSIDFYVYGEGSAGWEHYDHDRIDIIPDKKKYKPGDTATILVKSPFNTGTGLLTVERNGVRHYELFEINSSSPHLNVKLGRDDSPNVYVSVLLVRGRISEKLDRAGKDPGKPAFKVGYAELLVENEKSKLNVAVTPDRKEAGPGEEMEISVKVADFQGSPQEAEVAVIVADAALLQLASENNYYPEELFFAPRALAVWTSDIRLNLIGRRHYGLKGANAGGGGAGPGADKFRKKFVSLALFEPHLLTDRSGEVKVKFKLPDNLTTFKIFAVANGVGETFGTGVEPITVSKPLLIKSGLPNFAGIGDKFQASISVHNLKNTAGEAIISLSGENFKHEAGGAKTVKIEANASVEVGFPVIAEPGKQAVFRFHIKMDKEEDAAEFSVPLRYPNPLITAATYGRITSDKNISMKMPEGAASERGGLTLSISPSLIGSLNGAVDYLKEYPHPCLEQKTSKAMGDLVYLTWLKRFGGSDNDSRQARDRLESYLRSLGAYQNYDGGFSFWLGTWDPDPYLSGFVLQFLTYAKRAGLPVDQEVYNRAVNYALTLLKHEQWPSYYSEDYILATKTYLTAVLAEAGKPIAPTLETLYAQRAKMGPFELSLLIKTYAMFKRDEKLTKILDDLHNRLFARAVITSGEVHFEEKADLKGLMASSVRTNAFALRALLAYNPTGPHVVELTRWIVNNRNPEGHWGTTQGNAFVLLALTEYVKELEENPPGLSVTAKVEGEKILNAYFNSFNNPLVTGNAPASRFAPGKKTPVELDITGKGAVYYTMRFDYANKEIDLSPAQSGMTLTREYTVNDKNAKATGEAVFKRGDIVKVTVTMLIPHQRHWIVLEDQLPAGLEPLNFDLPITPRYLQDQLKQESAPEEYYRTYWYEHREIRHDRVVVYARRLREGVYTFSYLARAVTPGVFTAPGAKIEEMYSPETFGRSKGDAVEIR